MAKFPADQSIILYIENVHTRKTVRSSLGAKNIKVFTVTTTKEAIEKVEKDRRAALILDWSGISTIKVLSASKGKKPLDSRPIILIVEAEHEGLLEVFADFQMNRLLLGPLNILIFDEAINTLFDKTSPVNTLKMQFEPYLKKLSQKNYSDAKSILEIMRAKNPKNLTITQELANLCILMEEWEEAEKLTDEVLRFNSKLARAAHLKARCLMEKKDDKGAEVYLERATQLNPLDINRLIDFGNVLLNQGKHKPAKKAFTQASDIDPYNKAAAKGGATASFLLGEHDEAIELLQQLGSERERAAVFNNTGVLAVRQKSMKQAVHLYDIALNFIKDSEIKSKIYYNKSLAFVKKGDLPPALEAVKEAASLDPQNKKVKDLLAKVREVTGPDEDQGFDDSFVDENLDLNDMDEEF